jgi:hypothetical protein
MAEGVLGQECSAVRRAEGRINQATSERRRNERLYDLLGGFGEDDSVDSIDAGLAARKTSKKFLELRPPERSVKQFQKQGLFTARSLISSATLLRPELFFHQESG